MPDQDYNAVLYRIAELRITQRKNADEIVRQITKEFPGAKINRELVILRLSEAFEAGLIRLQPPIEKLLADRLQQKFRCEPNSIRVVECPVQWSNAGVSHAAAEWAVDLVKEISVQGGYPSVTVGLGPGSATLDFAQRFSRLMIEERDPPKLNLVAISSGCPADKPQYSSVSYFNLFSPTIVEKRIGFFAETFMQKKEFERLKKEPRYGIKEAFEAKPDIRLIVTSMSDNCEHALFRVFHDQSKGKAGRKTKWWSKCVGDCQYRPFSEDGPIEEGEDDLRASTIFELQELSAKAREKHTHVILIARPCWECPPGRTRWRALLPLLRNDNLRVWSKLVVDSATARELLRC